MGHPLDRPVLAALTTRHARVAQASGAALRYDPGFVPFAAPSEAAGDLAALVAPGEVMALVEAGPLRCPDGFTQDLSGELVQMLATRAVPAPQDAPGGGVIIRLGPEDAADMVALAEATRPGPFTLRAQEIGRFWGVRQGGRLIAMAGERMAVEGYVEISGVCVADTARGQGLARRLSCHVAAQIQSEGDVPFLHSYASNGAAVALYRSIGFAPRAAMSFGVFRRHL